MRALTKREKVLTSLVAVALTATLVQYLVIRPQHRALVRARTQLAEVDRRLAETAGKVAALAPLKKEVARKRRELKRLGADFGYGGELAEALNRLTTEIQRHGLVLEAIRPLTTTRLPARDGASSGYRESRFQLELSGGYMDLGEFMAAVERLPFAVRVVSMEVERQGLGSTNLQVGLTVALLLRDREGRS